MTSVNETSSSEVSSKDNHDEDELSYAESFVSTNKSLSPQTLNYSECIDTAKDRDNVEVHKLDLDMEIEICEGILEDDTLQHDDTVVCHVEGTGKKDEDEPSLFDENGEEFDISILEVSIESTSPPQNGEFGKKPMVSNVEVSILETEDKSFVEKNGDIGNKANGDIGNTVKNLPELIELDCEAEDLNDPGWEVIKTLSTNEARYEQVRNCWKSSTIPDPNRNLTYHSFRKRQFQYTKGYIPRKRAATTNLDSSLAKRPRSCTLLYDRSITSLNQQKLQKIKAFENERNYKVGKIHTSFNKQRMYIENGFVGCQNEKLINSQLMNLRVKFQKEMYNVTSTYNSRSSQCVAELRTGIRRATNARHEVLQFFKFYKGVNNKDPTVLTASQLQEEEEIEKIYSQFDKLYK